MPRHGPPYNVPVPGHQHQTLTLERHGRTTRNPWAHWPPYPESPSPTNSSTSSRTYQAVESCYQEFPAYALPRDAVTTPFVQPAASALIRPPVPVLNPQHQHVHSNVGLHSSRPITPASCVTTTDGGADACGGHCVTLENFCHYCLQVLFIAGILTGISLTIAGSILRGKKGGDLMVLVYIGVLTALVCTVLLSVQCCVKRRHRTERRPTTTSGTMRRTPSGATAENIPLQNLTTNPTTAGTTVVQQQTTTNLGGLTQQDPLLRRFVQQQIIAETGFNSREQSGVPWWRRDDVR